MTEASSGWFYWAVLSAVFAALTAIFAKVGIQGVNSDLATLVRTAIIIIVLSIFVGSTGKWSNPLSLPAKTWIFLDYPAWQRVHHGCAIFAHSKLGMRRKLRLLTN